MDMGFFLQKERFFPGVHKIGAAISGPGIADTNFTDTRIFLKNEWSRSYRVTNQHPSLPWNFGFLDASAFPGF